MSETVLLIEDSPTQALRIRIGLEQKGLKVLIVNQSTAAIETAKENTPDVVLSDVRMPGMDGFDLCKAIRADSELSKLPVVLTSATVNPSDEEKAFEAGGQAFIEKGLDTGKLADLLRDVIAKGV
mgnify:FL=1